jgi:DNA-binding NarL/FixJ family response regulator
MSDRRVFIIWTHPLGHEAIRLILNHPDVEIVGATGNHRNAPDEIAHLQPDTVIVEEPGGGVSVEALAIMEASPWVKRVISFNMDDNRLNVYQHEEKTVGQADDLLHLIQGD